MGKMLTPANLDRRTAAFEPHRTLHTALVARGCWLLEREEHRTAACESASADWCFDSIAALSAFSVWTQFTVPTGKRSGHPRGMHWPHACKSCKRAGVGPNGILECTFLPRNAHRTPSRNRVGGRAFSVSTQFRVPTGKTIERPRGMLSATHMQELQASRHGNQWHPRL